MGLGNSLGNLTTSFTRLDIVAPTSKHHIANSSKTGVHKAQALGPKRLNFVQCRIISVDLQY